MTINSAQAVNARVDVLCHELAHVLVRVDRHDDDPTLGYAEEELRATTDLPLAPRDQNLRLVTWLVHSEQELEVASRSRRAGMVRRRRSNVAPTGELERSFQP